MGNSGQVYQGKHWPSALGETLTRCIRGNIDQVHYGKQWPGALGVH